FTAVRHRLRHFWKSGEGHHLDRRGGFGGCPDIPKSRPYWMAIGIAGSHAVELESKVWERALRIRSSSCLRVGCLLILAAALTVAATPSAYTQTNPISSTREASQSWCEKTLASMTLDEKIGQLIVPAVVGMFLGQDSDTYKQIARDIIEFHVGGYHMLGEANYLHEPAGVALLINHLQQLAKVPLWITADFEGGVGAGYLGATRRPGAMAIGATGDPESAATAGRIAGEEARALGFQVNFYPVVDVNNNPRNPIINIRSFGSDPALVSRMAQAYIRGLQSTNVMATAKHVPGHGDTSTDYHLELPVVDVDRARLESVQLPPFKSAVASGYARIMSAHSALPPNEPDPLPATLSPKFLTRVLRQEMNFRGVLFTDAMTMQGVSAHYGEGESAGRALKAGADVLL